MEAASTLPHHQASLQELNIFRGSDGECQLSFTYYVNHQRLLHEEKHPDFAGFAEALESGIVPNCKLSINLGCASNLIHDDDFIELLSVLRANIKQDFSLSLSNSALINKIIEPLANIIIKNNPYLKDLSLSQINPVGYYDDDSYTIQNTINDRSLSCLSEAIGESALQRLSLKIPMMWMDEDILKSRLIGDSLNEEYIAKKKKIQEETSHLLPATDAGLCPLLASLARFGEVRYLDLQGFPLTEATISGVADFIKYQKPFEAKTSPADFHPGKTNPSLLKEMVEALHGNPHCTMLCIFNTHDLVGALLKRNKKLASGIDFEVEYCQEELAVEKIAASGAVIPFVEKSDQTLTVRNLASEDSFAWLEKIDMSDLKRVVFTKCKLLPHGIEAINTSLQSNLNITELSFFRCDLASRPETISALSKLVTSNSQITGLDLVALALASNEASEILAEAPHLSELCLRNNNITELGFLANLARHLVFLDLSSNKIGNNILQLSASFLENKVLTSLLLKNSMMRDVGVAGLVEALNSSESLRALDLSTNTRGFFGLDYEAIAKVNMITPAAMLVINDFLAASKVKYLNLTDLDKTCGEFRDLRKAATLPPIIRELLFEKRTSVEASFTAKSPKAASLLDTSKSSAASIGSA